MLKEIPIPSQDADLAQWHQWAWLAGYTECRSCLPLLKDLIHNRAGDLALRKMALSSYWTLETVENAINLQDTLVRTSDAEMALLGVQHPRWWHEKAWVNSCENWLGRDSLLDQAVIRLWNWSNRPTFSVRIPKEVLARTQLNLSEGVDWAEMWRRGRDLDEQGNFLGFEKFWPRHIRQWSSNWIKWEEAVTLYRWRLDEEGQLAKWAYKNDRSLDKPQSPEVDSVQLPQAQNAQDALMWMILGLGYHLGRDESDNEAAAWDSIWSSWAASLNYALYEVLSNIRITEWHIAGLSGFLRDGPISEDSGPEL